MKTIPAAAFFSRRKFSISSSSKIIHFGIIMSVSLMEDTEAHMSQGSLEGTVWQTLESITDLCQWQQCGERKSPFPLTFWRTHGRVFHFPQGPPPFIDIGVRWGKGRVKFCLTNGPPLVWKATTPCIDRRQCRDFFSCIFFQWKPLLQSHFFEKKKETQKLFWWSAKHAPLLVLLTDTFWS